MSHDIIQLYLDKPHTDKLSDVAIFFLYMYERVVHRRGFAPLLSVVLTPPVRGRSTVAQDDALNYMSGSVRSGCGSVVGPSRSGEGGVRNGACPRMSE